MNEILKDLGINIDFYVTLAISGLIFARLIPAVFLAPFLGGQMVPARVKIGTGVALVIVLYFPVSSALESPPPLEVLPMVSLLGKEVFLGLVMGFIAAMFFYIVEAAGRVLDTHRGMGTASLHAPQMKAQVSLFGQLNLQLTIVLFLLMNGHIYFLKALMTSFQIIPITSFPVFKPGLSPFIEWIAKYAGTLFSVAIQLFAPAFLAIFFTDLTMGIANRVAPQINVFMLSLPIKMMVGTLMVLLILSLLVAQIKVKLWESIYHLDTVLELLKR